VGVAQPHLSHQRIHKEKAHTEREQREIEYIQPIRTHLSGRGWTCGHFTYSSILLYIQLNDSLMFVLTLSVCTLRRLGHWTAVVSPTRLNMFLSATPRMTIWY
jgi:hypothetical protein